MILIRRVVGHSMTPTLRHGQLVIGYKRRPTAEGKVVIARRSDIEVIKRIESKTSDKVVLASDNPRHESFEVYPREILAVVIWPPRAKKRK